MAVLGSGTVIRRILFSGLVFVILAGTVGAQNNVSVHIELSQAFYYEGDELRLRISVRNDTDEAVDNPLRTALAKGFRVATASGETIDKTGSLSGDEPERPAKLAPRSFYGGVFDMTDLFPRLRGVGTYRIGWQGDGLLSPQLTVKIVPRYDHTKTYVAEIVTSRGPVKISFMPERSPLAVKAFIDMANSDFYDGQLVQEVRPDEFIVAGEAQVGQAGRTPFFYPLEPSSVPLMAGMVVMKPVGASPPANGPEFIILLKPQPNWAGQVTILGQVVEGLELVREISRVPSSGTGGRPFFKPLEDLEIQTIRVQTVTGASTAAP